MPESNTQTKKIKAAIFGARGYVGVELIQILDTHPLVELVAVYSRAHEGQKVSDQVAGFSDETLTYEVGDFAQLPQLALDVLFLALPDGLAKQHDALWQSMAADTVIIDLSADYRFDTAWTYGQPETHASDLSSARLIANPGCYATGMQLGLRPLLPYLADASVDVPTAFGVSGYSGAGTSPSDKNDPARLADNLLAYKPTGHTHEKEVAHVLQHNLRFMPHVASHFRGIHLTLSGKLNIKLSATELQHLFEQYYQQLPLIQVQTVPAEIQQVANHHHLLIGGFAVSETEPEHFVLNVALDNLLKGAATQATQNMNLACAAAFGCEPLTGIYHAK
ncbi:N-acetyl-gamma-glutamyl-phosphate reductase [Marinicella sp. S1101]|uniref:N-acetyl-gamma-glutamyl-phosphate reductase n=1 Tax=Marinicella marina TaxID=2996016 RepID=UPI002260C63F|nr:N-acetyl-gamma-glutamyl-phosphate reductase [Marinicella marina]MCX7552591.1 N-acetyl-gamma-glutamyl-phosphate reductase [Marinicella marina]MDJ1139467.1 N-acetyl-gamma-glutamyl-phosphate reductase [Marinicella marina]